MDLLRNASALRSNFGHNPNKLSLGSATFPRIRQNANAMNVCVGSCGE